MLEFQKIGQKIELNLKKDPITLEQVEPYIASVHQYGEPKDKPKISALILAYNEGNDLLECLSTIYAQDEQDFEVVLLDNGLDPKTKSALRDFRLLHVIAKYNLGCTHGRNVGAAYCRGELMTLVDADGLIPARDYFSTVLEIMRDPALIAVRGKVSSKNGSAVLPVHYDLGDKAVPQPITAEGCSTWRLGDFKRVGGFEASLYGGEGLVLCYRMHELYGYDRDAFTYNPRLVLRHDFHGDLHGLAAKMRRYAIIKDLLYKRYPRIKELEAYYQSKRGNRKPGRDDEKLEEIATKQRNDVTNELRALYEQKAQERYSNPDRVKGAGPFDISVVITCYNLGKMTWGALASVMRQSIDSVQIIVVDDASTEDETKRELDRLEEHVELVRQRENGGVARARNEGIKLAKAKYVMCLDADDTVRPTYLEKACNLFEADESAGIVTAGVQFLGGRTGTWHPQDKSGLREALLRSPVPAASCFRRDAWEQGNGYDERLRGYEDWDFWLRILETGLHVRVIPEVHIDYFDRLDSKVKKSNKNAIELVSRIVENHRKAYQDNVDYVVAAKHKEVVDLRNSVLQLKATKTRKPNKLRKLIRFAKRAPKTVSSLVMAIKRDRSR